MFHGPDAALHNTFHDDVMMSKRVDDKTGSKLFIRQVKSQNGRIYKPLTTMGLGKKYTESKGVLSPLPVVPPDTLT